MEIRNGICAVVFRKRGKKKEFLVLHRVLHWKGWEFPKGGSEPGETNLQALRRELNEELGIKELLLVKKIPLRQVFDDFVRMRKHDNQAFIVELPASLKVDISKDPDNEHSSFRWVSSRRAVKLITFKDAKEIFKKALRFID